MGLLTFVAGVLYLAAVLFAQGWLFGQSITRALACVAAGLLASLLAGAAPALPRPHVPRPPANRDS